MGGTFIGCTSLTSVDIPNSVTSLEQTFRGCTSLTSVNIPSSVTEFIETFEDCTNLSSLYAFSKYPRSLNTEVFVGVNTDLCVLYVPKGCLEAYKSADGWKIFTNIKEFDPTDIEQTELGGMDFKEVKRYSVNGQRLDTPTKGLNIVRMSDGSTRKVLVK